MITTDTEISVVNTSLTIQTQQSRISLNLTIHLIYYFLIKKTVTVGINWINYCSLLASLALAVSLRAMKPVDSSCGKKIQPQLWVTQHTPARWASDSASPVQPRRCRTPTTLPRPRPALLCQVARTEPGSELSGGRWGRPGRRKTPYKSSVYSVFMSIWEYATCLKCK